MITTAVGVTGVIGCAEDRGRLGEIETAFERGEFRETVALCRHAVRKGDDSGSVYFYYGASLLELGRDFEAFRQFDAAIARDPEMPRRIGAVLYRSGEADFRNARQTRAADRLRKSVEVDPSRDLRGYRYLVADRYFSEKRYDRAGVLYREALEALPDTSAARDAFLNLATALMESGSAAAAREVLAQLLNRYPRGSHRTEAQWRLANLTYDYAESQFVQGNYRGAIDVLTGLAELTSNGGLLQKAWMLSGESYEALGEFRLAYDEYRKIIEEDRGASGRIVERAREKIRVLREAGLN